MQNELTFLIPGLVFGGLALAFIRARVLEYVRARRVLTKELTLTVLDIVSLVDTASIREVMERRIPLILVASKLGKTRWQRYVLRQALVRSSVFPGTSVISKLLLEIDYGTLTGYEWIKALVIPSIKPSTGDK